MATRPLATVAILSIGQMGLGIAKLLQAHSYRVITNVSDRSAATQERARSAGIQLLNTDEELVAHADYVLSIVPPRDAVATAKRVEVALSKVLSEGEKGGEEDEKGTVLYYLDLNAISPSTVKAIHASFSANTPSLRFIDGGIISGPPVPPPSDTSASASAPISTLVSEPPAPPGSTWTRPGIPLSGPYTLSTAPVSGLHLSLTLNTQHLSSSIGSASGLKCCFASLSKGLIALGLQSYTTAQSLGVLAPLQAYLDEYNPGARGRLEKSMVGCTTKAYRWVEEMRMIGECFGGEGGWRERASVFREIAGVFEGLADGVEGNGGTEGMQSVEGVVGVLGRRVKEEEEEEEEG